MLAAVSLPLGSTFVSWIFKRVDFFWTVVHMLPLVAFVVGILLVIFFIMDTIYYKQEEKPAVSDNSDNKEKLQLVGVPNMILLPCIVLAVLSSSLNLGTAFTIHYVEVPSATILQVALLLLITFVSLKVSKPEIREGNGFNWEPIKEVAKLFATIFMTMVTPIAMLKAGADGPMGAVIKGVVDSSGEFINSHFFWAQGFYQASLTMPQPILFF
jgi:Na+/H+ antiporter NhaD/arsenite permease-like protein